MGLSDVAMNDIDYMDFELGKRENCAPRAGAVEPKHGGWLSHRQACCHQDRSAGARGRLTE